MSNSGSGAQYFWCTRHHRVETEADVCPAVYVLGPYPTHSDAARALQTVEDRNEAWDEEDRPGWGGELGGVEPFHAEELRVSTRETHP